MLQDNSTGSVVDVDGFMNAGNISDAIRLEIAAELLQITKVSKIHGIGSPLIVTPTSRTAGDISQTITTLGDTTTVSAA